MSKNEILKEQQKKDFINKLSDLLNKQEMIMEESFNEAANRGKFKQSSEGSGGRTSKEKQDNLRNTLGNIMRDIGESENEIPQELGRADRAMRQATRELENGRPDQASNAQGRATEMIRRAMNRMRDDNSKKLSKLSSEDMNIKSSEKEINFSEADNDLEYQGTALGGTVEIPKSSQIQKAQKIAFSLQHCLDFKDGGEVAENLNYLYRHIRFAAKNLLEKEKTELLTSAHFVSNEILEGWKGMNSSVA